MLPRVPPRTLLNTQPRGLPRCCCQRPLSAAAPLRASPADDHAHKRSGGSRKSGQSTRPGPDTGKSGSLKPASAPRVSIFRELFPDVDVGTAARDDARSGARGGQPRQDRAASRRDGAAVAADASRRGNLWRESLDKDDLRSWLRAEFEAAEKAEEAHADAQPHALPHRDQMPAMLVLSNASKSLAESDFYRIGRQGQHLEGWNGSISKVIQAYDRNTLEPLGCYFILFTSKAAARAYQQEAERLHRSISSKRTHPAVTEVSTLSPATGAPLNLRLCSLPPSTVSRLNMFALDGILRAASRGASTLPSPSSSSKSRDQKQHQQHQEHSVILSLEGGAIDKSTLQGFLRRDEKDRNLAWDIITLRPYFAQRIPAEANGSSNKKQAKKGEGEPVATQAPDQLARDAEEDKKPPPRTTNEAKVKSGRFVISFRDVHEARRFVRTWHRREFSLPARAHAHVTAYGVESGQQEGYGLGGNQARSEEQSVVTVNAMIPW